jgi:hypothetical protein
MQIVYTIISRPNRSHQGEYVDMCILIFLCSLVYISYHISTLLWQDVRLSWHLNVGKCSWPVS